ncbi:MAG: translation initiation factor IF-2 [Aerococcus sp.]|nr:translation initiation factor IF-2 [Aerococcus sp.]
MSKKRIYKFAKENNMSSKEMLSALSRSGFTYKSHMAMIGDEEMNKVKALIHNDTGATQEESKPSDNNSRKQQTRSRDDHAQNGQAHQSQQHADKREKQQRSKRTVHDVDHKSNKKSANDHEQNNGHKQNKKRQDKTNGHQKGTSPEKNNKQNAKKKRNKNKKDKNQRKQKFNPNMRKTVHHDQPRNSGPKQLPDKIEYSEGMTVAELAKKLHRSPAEVVKKLFSMGVMATQNDSLESDAIELILDEYGVDAEEKVQVDEADFDIYFDAAKNLPEDKKEARPPVVTIMGHVDHGKTTLLDYLRHANVVAGEAGGITQHIGAYQVRVNDDRLVTFLDTPGHEAFTTMRARGADVTDIVVIVVAADDGVMPQTIEAINHAKAADVPIIVAINKIDKPNANPDHVKQELMEYELVPEEWGGDTIFVEISAKFGQGIDDLLEMITLVSDVQELEAVHDSLAMGTVIEARLDPHRGSIATVLVQYGTLNHGDAIVAGDTFGRVRTMTNDQGRRIQTAGPSTPVEITGLQEAPSAGDRFVIVKDEKTARTIGTERAMRAQEARRNQTTKVTLDNLFDTLQAGTLKTVNIVLKSDVQGSVEALKGSLNKIDVAGVKIDIIHAAVGAINESDVSLASASNAIIVGFNVRPTTNARQEAEATETDIRTYNIIYDLIEDIEHAMKGQLEPTYREEVTGEVTIRETYKVSKVGTIGGGLVTDGYITNKSQVRVYRDDVKIYEGELASLRRFKDDVKEVTKGYECGLTIQDYNDIKVDDVIEAYHMVEVEQ